MNTNIDFVKNYFTEEKIESLFFIIIGLISIGLSFIFWIVIKYSFYNGMAFPFLLIGLIQLVVGTTIYIRSPKDIVRIEQIIKTESHKISQEEIPRMKKVITSFNLYKWIEIILLVGGVILFLTFYNSNQVFWKGLALGLIIQASLMLSLDLIAEKRAEKYIQKLNSLI